MLIDGALVSSTSDDWFESINPATEVVNGRAPAAGAEDVDRAVAAAKQAFPAWAGLDVKARAIYLRRLARAIENDFDDLLALEVADSGNTLSKARADIVKTIDALEYYAGLGYEVKGETVPASAANLHLTVREPIGVVGRIVPFNHPFMFATAKLAAPLITGNTVIMKPSEQSPLTALRLGRLCAELFPPGVINILTGYGASAGEAIVRHRDVRRIAFIGSVPTGLHIQRAAAESGVKNVTLELGGKNPMIVFPDARLDDAIAAAVVGMNFSWAGQSCGSTSRLFLHESIYDEGVALLGKAIAAIRVGDPHDPDTEMGPVNSRTQLDKNLAYIASAHDEGAKLLAGGGAPDGEQFRRGYWLRPTAFSDVTPQMQIFREEIFGPILSVTRWSTADEVVELANSVEYGLTGAIWSNDINTSLTTARRLEAGYIWINGVSAHYPATSFGGVKNSGIGREESTEELVSYTEPKTIHVVLSH
jgi:acyl-CoA reductase-like NAD-dependent aldehyde dehydrogenase